MKQIMSYGRKVCRALTAEQKTLLEVSWLNQLFPLQMGSRIWLEIGFGYGEHLLHLLETSPEDGFIGVEVFKNGLAHFLKHLNPQDIGRCAIFSWPMNCVFPLIPPHSLDGIFILFPDPWPKRSHWKRRLIQPLFLQQCHACLKPKGTIHVASDCPDLFQWMLLHFKNSSLFDWVEGTQAIEPHDWPSWPEHFFVSRYRQKAIYKGKPCAYMIWEAIPCGYTRTELALEIQGQGVGRHS